MKHKKIKLFTILSVVTTLMAPILAPVTTSVAAKSATNQKKTKNELTKYDRKWQTYNSNDSDVKLDYHDDEVIASFNKSNGKDYWDSQLFLPDIKLANGKYQLSFKVKATKPSSIYFDIEDSNDYQTKYYPEKLLDLDTQYQTKTINFDLKDQSILDDKKQIKLQFNLGPNENTKSLAQQKLTFADFKLVKKANASKVKKQKASFTVNGDNVLVKDYKGFGVQWDPYTARPVTDQEWTMITKRVDYLHPSFVRVMLYANTYCKGLDKSGNPIYDFDSKANQALLRELRYLKQKKIPVILGEWEAPGRFNGAFSGINADNPKWAKIIVGFLNYLVNEQGFTNIKHFNYINEANSDWSYCADYDKWHQGITYLYDELSKYQLTDKVTITGPDTVWDDQNSWLHNIANDHDFSQKLGLYDTHMYPSVEEITDGKVEQQVAEQRSVVKGKDFYMTELGLVTGKTNGDSQSYIRDYRYGILMADAAAQVARGGFNGVSLWDLDDAMHDQDNGFPSSDIRSLKQWGFWNSVGGRLYNEPKEEQIRPHFYTWSLMTKLIPPHSEILGETKTGKSAGFRILTAKKGKDVTYVLIKDSNKSGSLKLKSKNLSKTKQKFYRYNYFKNQRKVNTNGFPVATSKKTIKLNHGKTFNFSGPGVIILSTKKVK
ncbi:hypothetical protein [Lactobacillus sp. ESL0681]|uniref:hypothetical protein n=1 Tax=Lactobacillus sp. ESL0681 TaxID=2983211 RepID=UPI0023F729F0|nr:hypothetical protein [Lactobacillus sp. ESL0681]WEV39865.1 hypothetical protein OZX59_06550 [Lactobacillus sp. ESL0681]